MSTRFPIFDLKSRGHVLQFLQQDAIVLLHVCGSSERFSAPLYAPISATVGVESYLRLAATGVGALEGRYPFDSFLVYACGEPIGALPSPHQANGDLHPALMGLLRRADKLYHASEELRSPSPESNWFFEILYAHPEDSFEEIRKRYKLLSSLNHPDHHRHKPAHVQKQREELQIQFNRAYRELQQLYGS